MTTLAQVRALIAEALRGAPAPERRSHPPLELGPRQTIANELAALRKAWATNGPRLEAVAAKAYTDAQPMFHAARVHRDVPAIAHVTALIEFQEKEARMQGALRVGASDLFTTLAAEIASQRDACLATVDRFSKASYEERALQDRAVYMRAARLDEFAAEVRTWPDLGDDDDQLRQRFDTALAAVPSVESLAESIRTPAPATERRSVSVALPNPNVTPAIQKAIDSLWQSAAKGRQGVRWTDA
ncbi:MAG: hypothetical protein ABI672_01590 [Vicinamibacteria bacterium]